MKPLFFGHTNAAASTCLAGASLLAGLLALGVGPVHAASPEPSPAAAAPAAPAAASPTKAAKMAPTASASAVASGSTYTVARGDTLDRVIQKTLPGSPLKIELLRQAFVQLNPQAFPDGRPARMQAEAVLQVPDALQLLRTVAMPLLESPDLTAGHSAASTASPDERRRWVRFP